MSWFKRQGRGSRDNALYSLHLPKINGRVAEGKHDWWDQRIVGHTVFLAQFNDWSMSKRSIKTCVPPLARRQPESDNPYVWYRGKKIRPTLVGPNWKAVENCR